MYESRDRRCTGGSGTGSSGRSRGAGGGSASPDPSNSASWPFAAIVGTAATVVGSGTGDSLAAVDAKEDGRSPTLDLHRSVRDALPRLLVKPESAQHPSDRRLLADVGRISDRSGDDEPLLRAGHRDVVEAQPLGLLGALPMSPDVLVGLGADACPRRRVRDLEAEPPVGQGEDVRRGRTAAPCVRDHHDLELQPLGGVDREEPDRVGALLLRDRVGFLRPHRLLPLDEPHEALDLRAPELLVRPGQPGELAQVRVPAATVRAREHGEVVVVLRDDALAEELERGGRGHLAEDAHSAA